MESMNMWSRIKHQALRRNLVPLIFSSHCCSCLWEAFQREELLKVIDLNAAQEQDSDADLLIVHGPLNEKRLAQVQSAYNQLRGKKYVLGIGIEQMEQIPFDLIIPGCPVSADAVLDGIEQLRKIR